MKAIAVYPGRPNSVHLEDIPPPTLDAYPDGRGVLVRVLKVGVDATDGKSMTPCMGIPLRDAITSCWARNFWCR